MKLSQRVQALQPSATFAIKAKAAELRAAGHDVVDLSPGEPDGLPPTEAGAAAIAAIEADTHYYGPVTGSAGLRGAIAEGYQARGWNVSAGQVLVTHGGKQALYNLAMALLDPGDEVVVFSPYWVSYLPQIELTGARAVVVRTRPEDGFQPDPAAVEAAITDRTKVLLLNSPSNPTGTVWDRSRIAAIAELARVHDLLMISDEIYDAITYDGAQATCVPALSEDAAERTVVVHAVSKSFAMTGWRVGWMVGPTALIKACSKIHGHTTSGISLVTQAAAEAALRADPSFRTPMLEALNVRRHAVIAGLATVDGIELGPVPMGAFYAFPRVDGLFGKSYGGKTLNSAMDVATYFIEHGGVAVVPGEAFGEPRCVRLSYAIPTERLTEGLRRLGAAVAKLG